MNKERFLQLIDAVEKQPENLFNMHWWVKETDCGTAGCAVGAFCLQHPEAELKLVRKTPTLGGLNFDGASGMRDCATFWGIPLADARHIFLSDSYLPDEDDDETPIPKAEVLGRLKAYYEEHQND